MWSRGGSRRPAVNEDGRGCGPAADEDAVDAVGETVVSPRTRTRSPPSPCRLPRSLPPPCLSVRSDRCRRAFRRDPTPRRITAAGQPDVVAAEEEAGRPAVVVAGAEAGWRNVVARRQSLADQMWSRRRQRLVGRPAEVEAGRRNVVARRQSLAVVVAEAEAGRPAVVAAVVAVEAEAGRPAVVAAEDKVGVAPDDRAAQLAALVAGLERACADKVQEEEAQRLGRRRRPRRERRRHEPPLGVRGRHGPAREPARRPGGRRRPPGPVAGADPRSLRGLRGAPGIR